MHSEPEPRLQIQAFVNEKLFAFDVVLKERYAVEIFNFIRDFDALTGDPKALNKALAQFNHLLMTEEFTPGVITVERPEIKSTVGLRESSVFKPLGQALALEIHDHLTTERDIFKKNILKLVLQVIGVMDQVRVVNKLIYHQIWHAFEMMKDVLFLVQVEKRDIFKWISALSALYHDLFFRNNNRLVDETDSCSALIQAISPLLERMPEDKAKIEALIRMLIVGGTTPALLKPATALELSSVWAMAVDFMQTVGGRDLRGEQEVSLLVLSRVMSDADIRRSDSPYLISHFGDITALLVSHADLREMMLRSLPEEAFLGELVKIGQGLRIVTEKEGKLSRVRDYLAKLQQEDSVTPLALTQEEVTELAKAINEPGSLFSECAFSGIIHRSSGKSTVEAPWYARAYPFESKWDVHAAVLANIHAFLTGLATLEEKSTFMSNVFIVASKQQGKSMTLSKWQETIPAGVSMSAKTDETSVSTSTIFAARGSERSIRGNQIMPQGSERRIVESSSSPPSSSCCVVM